MLSLLVFRNLKHLLGHTRLITALCDEAPDGPTATGADWPPRLPANLFDTALSGACWQAPYRDTSAIYCAEQPRKASPIAAASSTSAPIASGMIRLLKARHCVPA